ncbi:MAG TPA: DUF177 domain-containing protein [Candidatus Sumerlaeota bacterium]|nr:DUF177 domain-containing protein [Candidatus Sumerlaeota bacterium]
MLRIEIETLKKGPVVCDIHLSPEFLTRDIEEDLQLEPATGTVTFTLKGENVHAAGALHSALHGTCAKCLEETTLPLDAPVALVFWPHEKRSERETAELEVDEPDSAYYDKHALMPEDDLRELILLEVPLILVCGDDCKGLCPYCGANLNTAPCSCVPPDAEPEPTAPPANRFWKDQLKNLKLD